MLDELRQLIESALRKGYKIVELQLPYHVLYHTDRAIRENEHAPKVGPFSEPSTQVMGTLFGYPYRDMPTLAVITY